MIKKINREGTDLPAAGRVLKETLFLSAL